MRRTEALQGVRMAVFLNLLHRWESAELNQEEAAELLGVSERTFRRWTQVIREEVEIPRQLCPTDYRRCLCIRGANLLQLDDVRRTDRLQHVLGARRSAGQGELMAQLHGIGRDPIITCDQREAGQA